MNIEIPDTILVDVVRAALLGRDSYGQLRGPLADAASRAVSAVSSEVGSAIEAALRDVLLRPEAADALRAACLEGACEAAAAKAGGIVRRTAKLDLGQVSLPMSGDAALLADVRELLAWLEPQAGPQEPGPREALQRLRARCEP